MAAQLVSFRSDFANKYLSQLVDYLRFSGTVVGQYENFEIVPSANINNGGLVHLRSTFNGFYWRRQLEDSSWIVASDDGINDDPSKWDCTLFKQVYVNGRDNRDGFRLLCVQNQCYVRLLEDAGPRSNCLYAYLGIPDEANRDVFRIEPVV